MLLNYRVHFLHFVLIQFPDNLLLLRVFVAVGNAVLVTLHVYCILIEDVHLISLYYCFAVFLNLLVILFVNRVD